MRLSAWRAAAPHRDAATAKVAAVVDPVLATFGAEPDPHCWVAWGDDPAVRYTILVPTDPGLISCFVRVNVSGEGPRVSTKLVRWNRVAIGELGLETTGAHRLLSFQVEQHVLRGVDAEADRVAAFALRLIAAVDGRPLPPVEERARRRAATARRGGTAAGSSAAAKRSSAKPAVGGRSKPSASSATAKAPKAAAATVGPASKAARSASTGRPTSSLTSR